MGHHGARITRSEVQLIRPGVEYVFLFVIKCIFSIVSFENNSDVIFIFSLFVDMLVRHHLRDMLIKHHLGDMLIKHHLGDMLVKHHLW